MTNENTPETEDMVEEATAQETAAEDQVEAEELDTQEGDDLTAKVIELESEIARLNDQVLRERAETANVRRRAEKDKQDASQYAVTSFARDMLTVADNLSRALTTIPDEVEESLKPVIDGVTMTGRELTNILERHGIQSVAPEMGEKFDPKLHQAMFEVPTEDQPAGTIAQVVATGYTIKDRLLRPAMVGVAKGGTPKVDTEA